ncbi:MgtC/SapB family protein [bacterium]|nr:MgtC/SapB family protein [bacterium]
MSLLTQELALFDFFFKCVIALIFGCVIGFERESKHKPAGIKTHAMICFGATILTYLSSHMSPYGDPTRIAAQIVSGIGFIGAGTIFHSKIQVSGLTSAAMVWVSAAIGMLIGASYISFAFVGTCLIVILFTLLAPKKTHLSIRPYSLNIEVKDWSAVTDIQDLLQKFKLNVHQKNINRKDSIYINIAYSTSPVANHLFMKRLFKTKGLGHILQV